MTTSLLPLILSAMLTGGTLKTELKLDTPIHLTDSIGAVSSSLVLKLKVGDIVQFDMEDKKSFFGIVTRSENFNDEQFKIIGDIQNVKNSAFGFLITKDGIFAGAVVDRDQKVVYKLIYNEEARCFVFAKTLASLVAKN